MNSNRLWVIGSAVLTVAILAAGWFIGASPMLSMAAVSDADRQTAQQQNLVLKQTLIDLQARYEKLPELQTQLDAIRASLPAEQELSAFLTNLNTSSVETRTTITAVTVSDALPYLPVAPEVEATTETEASDAEAAPDEEATAEGEVAIEPVADISLPGAETIPNAELVTADNFVATPVSVSVLGAMDDVMAFIDRLQTGSRLYLVTKVAFTQDAETGLYAADVDGLAYSLLQTTIAPEQPASDSASGTVTIN